MDCASITAKPEVIPVNRLAGRLDHSGDAVTKMSRKSRKIAANVKQMAPNEGENGLREFVPTC
jgi:hypothetical protein